VSEDEVIIPPWLPDTPESRAELAQYYQSIARLDRGIGRLIDLLKKHGRYENTLIISISDNGAAFPASKTSLYDPGMRLPCIVKSPGSPPNDHVSKDLIAWYDWVPTILDFAEVSERPPDLFGASLRPLLENTSTEPWRTEIYGAHTFHEITNYYPMRVIRSARYKFIWNIAHPLPFPFASDLWQSVTWQATRRENRETFGCRKISNFIQRPRFELYDLEQDPNETDNLATHPDHAARVDQFTEMLKTFQRKTRDPWLSKWEYE
jgi:N-sulfoglucosamine sulfohydrolase